MSDLKRYGVLHDYGTEGWKFEGTYDEIEEAVAARERDVWNGGGTSIIVEIIPVLKAYSQACYAIERKVRQ